MTLYYAAYFDRRRMRREVRALRAQSPLAWKVWYELTHRHGTDMQRLMMADLAEEHGYPVLSKMLREWTTTSKEESARRFKALKKRR